MIHPTICIKKNTQQSDTANKQLPSLLASGVIKIKQFTSSLHSKYHISGAFDLTENDDSFDFDIYLLTTSFDYWVCRVLVLVQTMSIKR